MDEITRATAQTEHKKRFLHKQGQQITKERAIYENHSLLQVPSKPELFKEEYDDLTPEQAQQIEKRYSDNMAAGEYVALQIVIEREG